MVTRQHKKRSLWRVIAIVAVVLIAGVAIATPLVLSLPPFGGEMNGERLARARANPLHRDGKFVNPLPPASYTWADVRNLFSGQFFGNEVREPPSPIPVVKVAPRAWAARRRRPACARSGSATPACTSRSTACGC